MHAIRLSMSSSISKTVQEGGGEEWAGDGGQKETWKGAVLAGVILLISYPHFWSSWAYASTDVGPRRPIQEAYPGQLRK